MSLILVCFHVWCSREFWKLLKTWKKKWSFKNAKTCWYVVDVESLRWLFYDSVMTRVCSVMMLTTALARSDDGTGLLSAVASHKGSFLRSLSYVDWWTAVCLSLFGLSFFNHSQQMVLYYRLLHPFLHSYTFIINTSIPCLVILTEWSDMCLSLSDPALLTMTT